MPEVRADEFIIHHYQCAITQTFFASSQLVGFRLVERVVYVHKDFGPTALLAARRGQFEEYIANTRKLHEVILDI